jgi:hypothetical protein
MKNTWKVYWSCMNECKPQRLEWMLKTSYRLESSKINVSSVHKRMQQLYLNLHISRRILGYMQILTKFRHHYYIDQGSMNFLDFHPSICATCGVGASRMKQRTSAAHGRWPASTDVYSSGSFRFVASSVSDRAPHVNFWVASFHFQKLAMPLFVFSVNHLVLNSHVVSATEQPSNISQVESTHTWHGE